jgi:hypothetical protein
MPVRPASPTAAIKSLAATGIPSGFACSTAKFPNFRKITTSLTLFAEPDSGHTQHIGKAKGELYRN